MNKRNKKRFSWIIVIGLILILVSFLIFIDLYNKGFYGQRVGNFSGIVSYRSWEYNRKLNNYQFMPWRDRLQSFQPCMFPSYNYFNNYNSWKMEFSLDALKALGAYEKKHFAKKPKVPSKLPTVPTVKRDSTYSYSGEKIYIQLEGSLTNKGTNNTLGRKYHLIVNKVHSIHPIEHQALCNDMNTL